MKSVDLKKWRAMRAMRKRKMTFDQIGKEFGVHGGTVRQWLRELEWYEEGVAELKKNPMSIEGLHRTGRLPSHIAWELKNRGTKTLKQVTDWSQDELLMLNYVGVKRVDALESLMAEFGLSLHPARRQPKVRETNYEKQRREHHEQWADPAFVAEQCRVVCD